MQKQSVIISASSPEEARQAAAELLHADPHYLDVAELKSGSYRATVTRADARLEIEFSEDDREVRVTQYTAPIGDGTELTAERVREQLSEAGLGVEPDEDQLADLLDRTGRNANVSGLVIARAIAPKHGRDGEFQPTFESGKSVGSQNEEGRIDFYERNVAVSVKEGDVLGHVIPAEKGEDGRDVRGNPIRARDGEPAGVVAGINVETSADGLEFRAARDGVVVFDGKRLSVSDSFEIRGDIDFDCGNIRLPHGAVTVRGTVRSGFTVTCGHKLTVRGTIEDAHIEVGGDVEVGRGIVMRGTGKLKAGGSVTARFGENAHIEAGGDVIIRNELSNCHVVAHGRINVTSGKGRIQGGSMRCAGGVEANQLGSPLALPTFITVGPVGHDIRKLEQERQELSDMLDRIRSVVGQGTDQDVLARMPPGRQSSVEELLGARNRARLRLRELENSLTRARVGAKRAANACVKVHKTAFPGTVINIAGCTLKLTEPVHSSTFYYDPDGQSIAVRPL